MWGIKIGPTFDNKHISDIIFPFSSYKNLNIFIDNARNPMR